MRARQGELKIIQMGASKGIRLPKWLMEECHFSGVVQFTIASDGSLVLAPVPQKDKYDLWAEKVDKAGGVTDHEVIPDEMDSILWEDLDWPESEYHRTEPVILELAEDQPNAT